MATGASCGIGRAIAERLAEAGALVTTLRAERGVPGDTDTLHHCWAFDLTPSATSQAADLPARLMLLTY
ncbi:hypothetical protein ACFYMW_34630 [Streptomyces sp. NPDC006692]|uniref:hypothetical protein n=1 Tax=unclassified Streptomyces TaxID=2593676 RepID=UPI0036C28BF8